MIKNNFKIIGFLSLIFLVGILLVLTSCTNNNNIKEMTKEDFEQKTQNIGPITAPDVETTKNSDEYPAEFKYNSEFLNNNVMPPLEDSTQCREYLSKALKLKYGKEFQYVSFIGYEKNIADEHLNNWRYKLKDENNLEFEGRVSILIVGNKWMLSNSDSYQNVYYHKELEKLIKEALNSKEKIKFNVYYDDSSKSLVDDECYKNMSEWMTSSAKYINLDLFTEDSSLTEEQLNNIRGYLENLTSHDKKHLIIRAYLDKSNNINYENNTSELIQQLSQTTDGSFLMKSPLVEKLPKFENNDYDDYYM